MTSYDPNNVSLPKLVSSVDRLKKYLQLRYGYSIQDLCINEPALKPVLEFFLLELDELNSKLHNLELDIKNLTNPTEDEDPYQGYLF